MLIPTGLLKKGWKWEALTVFLVSLFSLTRRYKSISILFPDASLGMVWVSSQRRGETPGSRQACFCWVITPLTLDQREGPQPKRSNWSSVDVFGGILFFFPSHPKRPPRLAEAGPPGVATATQHPQSPKRWGMDHGPQRRPLSRTRPRLPGCCPPGLPRPPPASCLSSRPPPSPGRVP